jgi:hypothetical protein
MASEDESITSPKTPLDWRKLIRDKGIRVAIQSLSVGQIYTIVTTIVALGAGALALVASHRSQPDDLVLCADANDYPKGVWMSTGRVLEYDSKTYSGGPPAVADVIVFDTSKSGHLRSDEPGSKGVRFTVDVEPRPGAKIHMKAVDQDSRDRVPYQSDADLLVSPDGCVMSTDLWWDNYDQVHPGQSRQSGTAKYFWAARDTYWVKRDAIPERLLPFRRAQ